MVLITGKVRFPLCYDCETKEWKDIKDPKMKKFFDIPEELYKKSSFLRSIKSNYLRFGQLSEKQIVAFKSTVEKLGKEK